MGGARRCCCGEEESAAGLEEPTACPDHPSRVGRMLENLGTHHDVGKGVGLPFPDVADDIDFRSRIEVDADDALGVEQRADRTVDVPAAHVDEEDDAAEAMRVLREPVQGLGVHQAPIR
jgi:hypothetical protein